MQRKQFFQSGGTLTGVGAFVAAVPTLITIPSGALIGSIITYVGVGLGGVGLLLFAIPFIPQWDEGDFVVRRVKRNDIKDAYAFCGGFFGDNFSSLNQVKEWFRHNDKMFWILETVKKKRTIKITEITGFYSILPLTDIGLTHVLSGQLDGRSFTTDHISENSDKASAFNIGVIASKGRREKHKAIGSLITAVTQLRDQRPVPLLTRPTTPEGLKLATRRGFVAIDGSGTRDMGKIYRHEDDEL